VIEIKTTLMHKMLCLRVVSVLTRGFEKNENSQQNKAIFKQNIKKYKNFMTSRRKEMLAFWK